MKVHLIQQNEIQKKNKTPQFKGATDMFFRYLATNQAVGANGVDVAFMVIPRTTTDVIKRGPAAGLETGRREASGTVNHSLVGVYGPPPPPAWSKFNRSQFCCLVKNKA